MMNTILKTTFLLRRGTAEVWERNNPVLNYGEPGYDRTNRALKIGDGKTPWKNLEYIGINSAELEIMIQDYLKDYPFAEVGPVYVPHVSEDGVLSWSNEANLENPEPVNIKGENGITPHIGENGNWFVGEEDTGVQAQGPQGPAGSDSGSGSGGDLGIINLGNGLQIDDNGNLSVKVADTVEADNTLPISSAAVHVTVGNIDSLLKLI